MQRTIKLSLLAASVMLLLALGTALLAQEKPGGDMERIRDALKADKKTFIAASMHLTEAEQKEFWPYYNSYQFDLQKLHDRLIKLIDDYAKNYKNLSDQDADRMVNEYLAIERDQLKLKELYFQTLRKTLPVKKVARYMQLENKMHAVVQYELAARVPLIK